MKKLTIIAIVILLLSMSLFAQAPDTLWTKTYGGMNADWGNYVQQTTDLGYIIAGSTESFGAGNTDIYLIKTNYLGDTLWTKTYGGSNADVANCVQQTNDDGYIIVGNTESYGAGGSDIWLIKTDISGNVTWSQTYGSAGNEWSASVKQTTDNGYIVSGTKGSTISPHDDVYLIKTNSLGDTLWTRRWNRPVANNADRGGEIQLTDDGGYIMVGHSYNSGGTGIKATLLKLNSSGAVEWWKAHGIELDQRGSSVLQTGDGGYIFSAYTGLANPDFWLVKTDNGGDTLWSKRYGGPNDEYPGQMCQTADSGYVIVGYTASFGSGGNDVWLLKTDKFGNEMWNLPVGSGGDDRGVSVQETVDEGFIVTGRTNSFGTGGYDVWMIRLTLIGWILQNSGTPVTLYGVSFSDANHGTVVGGNVILRTTNAGNTWTFQNGLGIYTLIKVCFTDEDHGTIVSQTGQILRTTNGGMDWTEQSSGTTNELRNVCFSDANNGTVVGDEATILRTTNGGATWIPQTSGATTHLYGVSFVDANNGWIVGANGTILKTTNGGTYWTLIAYSPGYIYQDVCFTDINHGTAVGGGGTIVRTTDGGSTWITQTSGTYAWLNAVSFADANNGTAVGGYHFNQAIILRTTDGGTTWFAQYGWTTESFYDVSFTDPYNGTVVGNDGIILRSSIPAITFPLTVPLENGWNMVSVPGINPEGMGVDTWWSGKDPAANVFKYGTGYQQVTTATPGEGYFMKHIGAQVYNTGDEWPSGGIQIVSHEPLTGISGWNLFGGYELVVGTVGITTVPPGLQNSPVYKYGAGYEIATTLEPGYGYWMKLTGAGQIVIPEALAKGTEPVEFLPKDWGKIVLTDATGVNYTLYAVTGEVDLNKYELPPMPPAGIFDIRFGSGRIAEDLSNSIQSIEMRGIQHPIIVEVENMSITLQHESGKEINAELNPGEEILIKNESIKKLLVLSGEIIQPIKYILEQNYPNPFNPTTTIDFSIPEATKVTLTIYNVLGEQISVLVNSELESGNYSYQWNARNVATGLYIYELRTDNFISVKKMLLLK